MRIPLMIFALLFGADIAVACSCGPAPPVLDAFERADAVVIARVLSVKGEVGPATFVAGRVYKGNVRVNSRIVVGSDPNAACSWSFHQKTTGHQFLLYMIAVEPTKGIWDASTCGRTRALLYATEDSRYLNNMTKLRGKTRVSGNYRGSLGFDLRDVANKRIRIVGENKTYETTTDAHGVYEMYDLPPGKYLLEPEIAKGWQLARYLDPSTFGTSQSPMEFTLNPNKHASVNVELEPSNAVEGKVVDPDGNPMKDVCVYLRKPDRPGRNVAFACTNQNGRFRIEAAPAGSYFVVLNQPQKGVLITIADGETVSGINFVVRPVRRPRK